MMAIGFHPAYLVPASQGDLQQPSGVIDLVPRVRGSLLEMRLAPTLRQRAGRRA